MMASLAGASRRGADPEALSCIGTLVELVLCQEPVYAVKQGRLKEPYHLRQKLPFFRNHVSRVALSCAPKYLEPHVVLCVVREKVD